MSTDGYCCACGRFRTLVYLRSMCRDCVEEWLTPRELSGNSQEDSQE